MLLISLSILGFTLGSAQNIEIKRTVIASAGDYLEDNDSGLSICWTMGEVAIETLESTNSTIILTQGFQQPDDFFTNITEINLEDLGINVFPNPASHTVTIEIETLVNSKLEVHLTNIQGELLQTHTLNKQKQQIDFSLLPDAPYYLVFFDKNRRMASLQVLKISKD